MPSRALPVRLEVWSDLQGAGGARLAFLPDRDVVSLERPDLRALDGRVRLLLAAGDGEASGAARAACTARHVLRVTEYAASGVVLAVEEWPIVLDVLDTAAGTLEVTAVHPLQRWADAGAVRVTPAGGGPAFTYAGEGTVAGHFTAWLAPWLTARGLGYWTLGTVEATDPVTVDLARGHALAQLQALAAAAQLEPDPVRQANGTWTLHLRRRAGSDAALVTLRPGGALVRVTRTRDATAQATAVLPVGADESSIADTAWRVIDVSGFNVDVADPAGGPGPVQIAGQWVGAAVQRADGTRAQIAASSRVSDTVSRWGLTETGGIAVGDDLELRADLAGTRVVRVVDPTVPGAALVEATIERPSVASVRNRISNPRGRLAGGVVQGLGSTAVPDGWTVQGTQAFGELPMWERVAPPAGSPIEDGSGLVWLARWGHGVQWVDVPLTTLLDPAPGDSEVSFFVACYVDADLQDAPDPRGPLRIALFDPTVTPAVPLTTAESFEGKAWLQLGRQGVPLDVARRLFLRITLVPGSFVSGGVTFGRQWSPATPGPVFVAGGQLTRSAAQRPFVDGAASNALLQEANAYLLANRTVGGAIGAEVLDRARLEPELYEPLVRGGEVRVLDPAWGLDVRARVADLRRGLVPTDTRLTLTPTEDAISLAAPGRVLRAAPRTVTEELSALARTPNR